MATIDIRRSHGLGADAAKRKAEDFARDMTTKLELTWQWEGERIRFKADRGVAKGTSGQITVSVSEVRVEIDLPLLLRALKGSIESKATEKLTALLA